MNKQEKKGLLPRLRFPEFKDEGGWEVRDGFPFSWEELLHQTFFVCLERLEFLSFSIDQIVYGTKEIGDFLLF